VKEKDSVPYSANVRIGGVLSALGSLLASTKKILKNQKIFSDFFGK
jgi:hypothetical protein